MVNVATVKTEKTRQWPLESILLMLESWHSFESLASALSSFLGFLIVRLDSSASRVL